MRRRTFVAALGGAVICPLAASAQQTDNDAATFPNRPIKIVVLFPAGGPSDVLARMIGQRMSENWGQPGEQ
jgi:tripartite-type tricarboxylate transporter receptor subunit TctC